jgi:hypothetical protein
MGTILLRPQFNRPITLCKGRERSQHDEESVNEPKPGIARIIIAGLVGAATRVYGWFSDRISNVEKRVDGVEERLGTRIGAVEGNLKDTDGRHYALSKQVSEIKGRLDERDRN